MIEKAILRNPNPPRGLGNSSVVRAISVDLDDQKKEVIKALILVSVLGGMSNTASMYHNRDKTRQFKTVVLPEKERVLLAHGAKEVSIFEMRGSQR